MKKKAVLALTLAGLVALQMPMVALADVTYPITSGGTYETDLNAGEKNAVKITTSGEELTVNGNVQNAGSSALRECTVYINAESSVEISGSVVNNGYSNAINASGSASVKADSVYNVRSGAAVYASSANIEVSKEVESAQSNAIYAINGATVTAGSAANSGSSPTIKASGQNTTVEVKENEDVTGASGTVKNNGTGSAIEASGSAVVSVFSAENNSATEATIDVKNCAQVTVESTVTNNGTGVAVKATQGTGVVKVGSVESKGTGVVAEGENYGSMGVLSTVIVENDVNASNVGVSVKDFGTVVVEGTITGGNVGVDAGDFGYVYAYEIKTGEGGKLVNGSEDHIYYIIKQEAGNQISNIEGTEQTQYSDYKFDYAQKDKVLKITVAEGYELKAGQIAVTLNADGSYSITVPEGGGVTLDTVLKAVEQAQAEAEEKKATVTGSEGSPAEGQWNVGPGGYWTYRTNGILKETWGYIANPYAGDDQPSAGWFWFDKNGVMATGWKEINGRWYYFNEAHDGTYGMMLVNTTTPDGKQVGADGAMIQ